MANMAKFQESMRKMREVSETSRAGLKWDDGEDDKMLELLKKDISIDDIAKDLKRTANSIKTRIVMNALKEIDENGKDSNKVLKEYKLSEEDVKEYKMNKEKHEQQKKIFSNQILNKNVSNPTIKDNYMLLKEIVAKMSSMEEKMGNMEEKLKKLDNFDEDKLISKFEALEIKSKKK